MKYLQLFTLSILCFLNSKAQTISGNVTWSSNAFKTQNTIIPAGATLTINNSATIVYDANYYIEVQSSNDPNVPGGRLILQNCTLTGGTSVSSPDVANWGGVFVCGNGDGTDPSWGPSLSQQSVMVAKATLQTGPCGTCKVVINRAEFGLANYNPITNWDGDHTSGGIIQATGAEVKNSEWAVDFKHYQNFNKNNPTIKYSDFSFFKGCSFSKAGVTGSFNWASTGLVRLHEVEGVSFYGNTFTHNWDASYIGIFLQQAGARVTRNCNNLMCTSWTGNTFTGFGKAIYALNYGSKHRVTVNYNTFTNNRHGVYIDGCDNPYVCRNTFTLNPNFTNNYSGISLENTTLYTVMENTVNTTGAASASLAYGISVTNGGELYNEVYKNNINNHNYGLYSDGINRSTLYQDNGLKFICNSLTNTVSDAYDITVYGGIATGNKGIAFSQGIFSGGSMYSVSNTFSGTLNTGHGIIDNSNSFNYYGSVPNGVTGPVTVIAATNIGCGSKICDFPCVTYKDPAVTFATVKAALLTQLQTTYGTPEFDRVLIEYQELIRNIIEIYMGEPENPDDEIRWDILEQVLDEAALEGYYGVQNVATNPNTKKYLIEYHIMKSSLLMQQNKYDDAIKLLTTDLTKFKLSEEQYDQLQELIQVITIQKQLKGGTKWNTIAEKSLVYTLANTEEFRYGTSLARCILNAQEGTMFEPLLKSEKKVINETMVAKSDIYPNPASTTINIPANIISYRIFDISGRLLLSNSSNSATTIDISSLTQGAYLIETKNQFNTTKTTKFTKQ